MKRTLIGIAGGTGSGKTTLASKLLEALPDASLLQHDWYYRDRSHLNEQARTRVNFDEPDALDNDLLCADLLALREGRSVSCPQYDFATHTRREATVEVEPRRVILVEGILLFAVPSLCEVFDLRLYVDAADDVRLMRRIKRDLHERGRDMASIETQYEGTVRPMHARHVAPSRSRAHLIIPGEGHTEAAVALIVAGLLHSGPA